MSKPIILICLLLVIFSYSPTIFRSNYVQQDQWRAFRYSTLAQNPFFRAKGNLWMDGHYFMTGQPLVWFGEFIEHTLVSQIRDFVYLRLFALMIVLLTVSYLGSIIFSWSKSPGLGVISLCLFVFVPGYAGAYFAGLTAFMQLICFILAGASFSMFNRRQLKGSFILFLMACLIYPIFAFIVFPLALIRFGFDGGNPIVKRFKDLVNAIVFYSFAAIIYYLFIKSYILICHLPSPDPLHQVGLQLKPIVITGRINDIIKGFYNIPILNFYSPYGAGVALILFFSVNIALDITMKDKKSLISLIVWSLGVFILSVIVLVISLSPWLFSHYAGLPPRCVVPLNFFFCGTIIGLFARITGNLSDGIRRYVPLFLILFLLIPSAMAQYRNSYLETEISRLEIGLLRSTLGKWLDHKGYTNNKYLLVVRPQLVRPTILDQYPEKNFLGDNAVLSSAENPVEILWMINAVLRERADHPIGSGVEITNCNFDQYCAQKALENGQIVLGLTNGGVITSKVPPFIINFSLLTSRPIYPVIQKIQKSTST